MATLLLRLAAPLQSWGADSKFETRKTNRDPPKAVSLACWRRLWACAGTMPQALPG